mmetsp:Transcript_8386/g.24637  ORF Transcript_8386/g.24637 Transcript_8386/m.24637 type:complete len:243 (-) Transcript_8386:1083-1811(-)
MSMRRRSTGRRSPSTVSRNTSTTTLHAPELCAVIGQYAATAAPSRASARPWPRPYSCMGYGPPHMDKTGHITRSITARGAAASVTVIRIPTSLIPQNRESSAMARRPGRRSSHTYHARTQGGGDAPCAVIARTRHSLDVHSVLDTRRPVGLLSTTRRTVRSAAMSVRSSAPLAEILPHHQSIRSTRFGSSFTPPATTFAMKSARSFGVGPASRLGSSRWSWPSRSEDSTSSGCDVRGCGTER